MPEQQIPGHANLEERIRIAARENWPDLPDELLDTIGTDIDRLAAILGEHAGHSEAHARSEARDAFASAISTAQGATNAGWVELLNEGDERPIARGQLSVFGVSPDTKGRDLTGAITSVHRSEPGDPLPAGEYVMRFEENGETRRVTAVIGQGAVAQDTMAVWFLEDGLPISIAELSAGD